MTEHAKIRQLDRVKSIETRKRDERRKDGTHMAHRTAMIDVGGGFRAIYGAGVMDRMLEDGINVDHCYGVSAGSANMVSFIAKQHGRNHTFYTQYAFRKEYASFDSYVKNHNFANLDYVYPYIL